MKQTIMNPVSTTGWTVGTELFVVPIRYWDDDMIYTARVSKQTMFDGTVIPDGNDPNFVYAFSDDYGHEVYLDRDMVFTDREEAILYRNILRDHHKMGYAVDFTKVWTRILKDIQDRRNAVS